MKRMGQSGQAMLLALILLAIGAMIAIPTLRLTNTSLKTSQIITNQAKRLYAADAMQEYVMWKLLYDTAWRNANLSENGATVYIPTIDVCGVLVDATVVMRAVPGQGGITLTTDDTIRPTKTVSASNPVSPDAPNVVANRSLQTFTYIIRLEQLSSNNTQKLDAIYDILPEDFGTGNYVNGSSYMRTDGGAWEAITDPSETSVSGQDRLRWPASGSFASPTRDFEVRQVKELKFQVQLTLPPNADNYILYNYIVINVGDITTFSGPQAPVKLGNGSKTDNEGMLSVIKTASPEIILPGQVQDITYTLAVSNNDTSSHDIASITDYLPPEFLYVAGSTTGDFGTTDPSTDNVTFPAFPSGNVTRQRLVWVPPANKKTVNSNTTDTLTFMARTTKDVSGSYYNEVFFYSSDFSLPPIFEGLGLTDADFQQGYSWNGGTVIVPAYDASANASGVYVDTNLALQGSTSISINSYTVR